MISKTIKNEQGIEVSYWNIKTKNGSKVFKSATFEHPETNKLTKAVNVVMSGYLDEASRNSGLAPVFNNFKPRQLDIPDDLNFTDDLIYGFIQCCDERFFNAISDVNVEYDAEELKHLLAEKTRTINKIKNRKINEIKKAYENVPPTIKVETEELEPVIINGKKVYDSNGDALMQKVVVSQLNPDYQACLDNIELVENYANELISQMQVGQTEMFAVEWSY